MPAIAKPLFFPSARAFGDWLAHHHGTAAEITVGFYKVGTGRPTLTWPDSVDEALRFGWIDGLRKSIDAESYQIRFTARRPGSKWSSLNVRKFRALEKAGRVAPAGLAAYRARSAAADYSYETALERKLGPAEARQLKANPRAWKGWQARAPSYRKITAAWVMSPKGPETRDKRLQTLIECSEEGLLIPPLRYGRGRTKPS